MESNWLWRGRQGRVSCGFLAKTPLTMTPYVDYFTFTLFGA